MRLNANVGLAEGSDLILMNAKWAVGLKGAADSAGGVVRKEEWEWGEYRGRPSWPQVDMGA